MALTLADASRILSAGLGQEVRALAVRPTAGGMVSTVWDVSFDHPPGRAALKVADGPEGLVNAASFRGERTGLQALRRAGFPVPEVLLLLESDRNGPPGRSVLGLEWIDGIPLGHATLSPAGRERLDEAVGEAVSALHTHTRRGYGAIEGEPPVERWADVFGPRLADMLEECDGHTDPRVIGVGRRALERIEALLPERGGPACLVHGDLWANNILVAPDGSGGAALRGFIDPGAHYADPEYELAYLEGFRTVGPRFFGVYRRQHAIDEGYPRRRTLYNLHTMLIHIWLFGDDEYHRRARALAESLEDVL